MSPDDAIKFIDACRERGVVSVRLGEFEARILPKDAASDAAETVPSENSTQALDEALLFASARN